MTEFETVLRSSLTANAISQIKAMILEGHLLPGQQLPSERSLSEALGLSRPTAREAISSLVAMNILETRQGAGTFVSSLRLGHLLEPLQFALSLAPGTWQQLFEARMVIEPETAALAAQRHTEQELQAIREACSTGHAAASSAELLQADLELHGRIVEASHNDILINLSLSISALAFESRTETILLPGVASVTVEDHDAITDAIMRRDAEEARSAMRAHLEHIRGAALHERADGTLSEENGT